MEHFGDQENSGAACGVCDVCAPRACVARQFHTPSLAERTALSRMLASLAQDDDQAVGRLYRGAFPDESVDRRTFEHLLAGLVRGGLVKVRSHSFEKDGQRIDYQRVSITTEGRQDSRERVQSVPLGENPALRTKRKPSRAKDTGPTKKATKDKDAARRAFFVKRARRARKS